jgi:uncharacterized protein
MSEIYNDQVVNDFQKQIRENRDNPVSLIPELKEWVIQAVPGDTLGWDVLRHPLVFGVPYIPAMNFLYNRQYEAKIKALSEYISEENWSQYIFTHERPHRFDAFEAICDKLVDGQTYWKLMASVWMDSENLWQVGRKRIIRLLNRHINHRGCFMNEDEQRLLRRLPDRLMVFRGHQGHNQKGFSWTLAYTTAVWFGHRFDRVGHGKVSQGVVQKSDLIGLVCGRNELEVVVDPRNVKDIQLVHHTTRPTWIEHIKNKLLSQFRLGRQTAHGSDHWDKVDRNAVELHRHVPEADLMVARLFAIFHDSCRRDECCDPQHGHRAADLVIEWRRGGKLEEITDEQFTKLEYAIRYHNGGKPADDPTIGVCFDSDRLDLIRVGIVPDPTRLSTQAARDLICMI